MYLPITTYPLGGPIGSLTGLRPRVLVKTYTRTWKTIGIDPAYNGLASKIEINLRIRHQMPRNASGVL
jgi:hypothetical protein